MSLEEAIFAIIQTDYLGGIGYQYQYACVFKGKKLRQINKSYKRRA